MATIHPKQTAPSSAKYKVAPAAESMGRGGHNDDETKAPGGGDGAASIAQHQSSKEEKKRYDEIPACPHHRHQQPPLAEHDSQGAEFLNLSIGASCGVSLTEGFLFAAA